MRFEGALLELHTAGQLMGQAVWLLLSTVAVSNTAALCY
jgi:hypothetical protein